MLIKILLFIFILGVIGSIVVGKMVSYHFKKFKLPFDPIGEKILKTYIIGVLIILLLILSFLFLIIVA